MSAFVKPVVLAGLCVLVACTTTHDVAKLGPDTYTVSVTARPGQERSMAVARAGGFCQEIQRDVLITEISGDPYHVHAIFRCLVAGDPQLKRPVYERAPDVIIQNR